MNDALARSGKLVVGLALIGALATARAEEAPPTTIDPPDLPAEFERLIPRGAIPSVDEPEFVEAGDAEIPDDAWILGVEVGGEARAYSLDLLNHHEVVNDRVGGKPIAAVW